MARDPYVTAWQSKRGTWDQLIANRNYWGPLFAAEARARQEKARLEARWQEERELEAIIRQNKPLNDWYGPALLDPQGNVYPVVADEEHDDRAHDLIADLYAAEYEAAKHNYRWRGGLHFVFERGWVRLSWYGEVTDGFLNETSRVTQAQRDALWDMAQRERTGRSHFKRDYWDRYGGGFRSGLRSTISRLSEIGEADFALAS